MFIWSGKEERGFGELLMHRMCCGGGVRGSLGLKKKSVASRCLHLTYSGKASKIGKSYHYFLFVTMYVMKNIDILKMTKFYVQYGLQPS